MQHILPAALVRDFNPDEPRDEGGRWTDGGGGGSDASTSFISPNVSTLTFDEAVNALNSDRQKQITAASSEIDDGLGIKSTNYPAIGAWSDGAENSMMVVSSGASTAQVRAASAMKGYIADQKAVLVFHPSGTGQNFLASFDVEGKAGDLHDQLLKDDLSFHTLQPLGSDRFRIHVFGSDQATIDAVHKAATDFGAAPKFVKGDGEFIGTTKEDGTDREQRDDARQKYQEVIDAVAVSSDVAGRNVGAFWRQVRDHWSESEASGRTSKHAGPGYPASTRLIDGVKAKGFSQLTMRQASIVLPPTLFKKYYGAACEFFAANAHLAPRNLNDIVLVVRSEPLYVHRDLQNVDEFTAWATSQGFDEIDDDLHVTVLYSKTAVDWDDLGDRDTDHLVVPAGGERTIEVLGDGAVALVFASTALARRHGEMLGDGASSDYDAYVPHVTINTSGMIPDDAVPYDGELIFGPEIFETIVIEKEFDESKHPRVPAGSPDGGQFGEGGGGGETSPEGTSESFNPKVVEVGGDEWNRGVAKKLEREYQAAKPKLEKISNNAVKESEQIDELNAPAANKWNALQAQDKLDAFNAWRKENEIDNYDEAIDKWNELSDAEKLKVAVEQGVVAAESGDGEAPDEDEEDEDAPSYPDEWDVMSGDQQSETEEHWKKANYDSVHESEVENWSSESAPDDARYQVATDFNDGSETEWAEDALKELHEVGEEFPFGDDQLIKAMKINYESGQGGGSYWQKQKDLIEFDDAMLDEIKTNEKEGEGQGTFEGIEAADYSKLLTDDMRASITTAMINAMDDRADKVAEKLEPPDYLGESVDEYLDQQWGEMADKAKFDYAYENDIVEKPESESSDTPSKPIDPMRVEALPTTYDPLNETTGADYVRTQRLAHYLSIVRARELILERLDKKPEEVSRDTVVRMDKKLWVEWKGSSTSQDGRLLQVATAEELGGRLNLRTATGLHVDELKSYADSQFKSAGGYKGVLAYIRAKWETTQYLLDKAGSHELELYRGLDLARNNKDAFDAAMKEKMARAKQMIDVEYSSGSKNQYTKLPTVKVDRNGAASTTTDITVANGWAKGGAGKITLRAVVPRTAAISIPAFGVNVLGEHEVVIAGTAWKGWDAWAGTAPPLDKLPIGPKGTGIGTNAPHVQQQAA